MGITDAYDSFTNSTETIDDENDNINNITDFFLLLSTPGGVFSLSQRFKIMEYSEAFVFIKSKHWINLFTQRIQLDVSKRVVRNKITNLFLKVIMDFEKYLYLFTISTSRIISKIIKMFS